MSGKTKPNTTKACIRQPKEIYRNTKLTHKKLKPGLVTFYDNPAWKQSGSILEGIALESKIE